MKNNTKDMYTKFVVKASFIAIIICTLLSFITKDITMFAASCISTIIFFAIKWSVDQKYEHK